MKKKYIPFCQNCGQAHNITKCSEPKNSLGIILFDKNKENIKILLIKRKNTIGFVQFIRGQYIYSDIEYIQTLFNVMTNNEIKLIQSNTFSELWEFLWMDKFYKKKQLSLKRKKNKSEKKFNKIKDGIIREKKIYTIQYFINNKTTFYDEQEWGFPKGRRNKNESNLDTALREFTEETNISVNNIIINKDLGEIIEKYKSYDNVIYKNIYYVGEYIGSSKHFSINSNKKEQYMEISDIQFMNHEEALDKIRPYLKEKKKIINKIFSILK